MDEKVLGHSQVMQLVSGENVAGHWHPQPEVVMKSTGLETRQAWG